VSETPRSQPAPRPQPQPRPQPAPEPVPAPQPVPPEPAPAPVKAGPAGTSARGARGETKAGPAGTSARGARGETRGEIGDEKEALAASQADLAKLRAVRRARLIKASILAAIAVVFITFVLQNATPVGLKVLGWTVSVRLIWVIVASMLLGAVAGYLVGRPDKQLLLHGPSRRQEDPR
jgi:uncharacterized integral membrane protein